MAVYKVAKTGKITMTDWVRGVMPDEGKTCMEGSANATERREGGRDESKRGRVCLEVERAR